MDFLKKIYGQTRLRDQLQSCSAQDSGTWSIISRFYVEEKRVWHGVSPRVRVLFSRRYNQPTSGTSLWLLRCVLRCVKVSSACGLRNLVLSLAFDLGWNWGLKPRFGSKIGIMPKARQIWKIQMRFCESDPKSIYLPPKHSRTEGRDQEQSCSAQDSASWSIFSRLFVEEKTNFHGGAHEFVSDSLGDITSLRVVLRCVLRWRFRRPMASETLCWA